jgi:DNA-binding HxlR family transcriptional regulator
MASHRPRALCADGLKDCAVMPAKPVSLDKLDHAILATLQDEGRLSLSELGRRIGLSQPAMSERVRRLEDNGVITGYGARIDPSAVGLEHSGHHPASHGARARSRRS